MINLRGRSESQFINAEEMYKDLCKELLKENEELKREIRKLTYGGTYSIPSITTKTGDTPT